MSLLPPAARPGDGLAWITGASSGIGRALAVELVRRGWRVAVSARREAELEALRAEFAAPDRIIVAPLDVTDAEAVARVYRKLTEAHGPVVRAVLNVGTFDPRADQLFDAAAFARLMAINVQGTANCLEPLARDMAAARHGQIAIVASIAGYRGLPNAVSYCASKAAQIAMAEAMKFNLDRHNVRIQVVCPGFVRTPLTDKNDFPMPFLMEPEDAARAFADGLDRDRFEIVFPWFFTRLVRFVSRLPYWLYFRVIGRTTGR